jgi:hypothetical protein
VGQLPFQQGRVTQVQFKQTAKAGQAIKVDMATFDANLQPLAMDNRAFHDDLLAVFSQWKNQTAGLAQLGGDGLRDFDQCALERDIQQAASLHACRQMELDIGKKGNPRKMAQLADVC